jgi:hypothetical protein
MHADLILSVWCLHLFRLFEKFVIRRENCFFTENRSPNQNILQLLPPEHWKSMSDLRSSKHVHRFDTRDNGTYQNSEYYLQCASAD